MNNDEVVLNNFAIKTVWEVAEACVDHSRKGWCVNMQKFHSAFDGWGLTANEIDAALDFLAARLKVIPLRGEEGQITDISVVPLRYQCVHCRMWLDMQEDPEDHIDLCLKLQKKIKRNKELLR